MPALLWLAVEAEAEAEAAVGVLEGEVQVARRLPPTHSTTPTHTRTRSPEWEEASTRQAL